MIRRMEDDYGMRRRTDWPARLYRALTPPAPFVHNPAEPRGFPMGRWNLNVGSGGSRAEGCVNLDLRPMPGVDVAADAARLPFADGVFQLIECDAVLEHVPHPERVMAELLRVLKVGGHLHLVTPFCHPYHAYPDDYRRFTLAGLRALAGDGAEVVAEGWRTGPTAALVVFVLEWAKLLLPWRAWRVLVHGVLGWALFPLRYLDLALLRSPRAGLMGNHCYIRLRRLPAAD